jgi:hypothetical protein
MNSFKSRLGRAEASVRGASFPECGLPPHGPGRIILSDSEAGLPDNPEEFCPRCGRLLWFVIEVVRTDEGGGVLS